MSIWQRRSLEGLFCQQVQRKASIDDKFCMLLQLIQARQVGALVTYLWTKDK